MAKSENSCFISAHRSYSYFLFLTVVGFGGDSYKKCRGVDRVSVHLTSGIAITVHSTSLLNGKRWATQRNEFGFSWFLIFKKKKQERERKKVIFVWRFAVGEHETESHIYMVLSRKSNTGLFVACKHDKTGVQFEILGQSRFCPWVPCLFRLTVEWYLRRLRVFLQTAFEKTK